MKIKKTYRLDEKTLVELDSIAEKMGLNQTQALEAAIHSMLEKEAGSHTLEMLERENGRLAAQIYVKDGQIESLSAALVAAQETARAAQEVAKAAQVLHAADKPELALETAEQKRTRWQRLMDAWRG